MRSVGDIKLLARAVDGHRHQGPASLADEGKKQLGSGVVAIVGVTDDGKAGVVVGVTRISTARFNAVDLVRKGAEALGGKGGGGRPDMAQAGGPDGSKADAALAAIEAALGGMNALDRRFGRECDEAWRRCISRPGCANWCRTGRCSAAGATVGEALARRVRGSSRRCAAMCSTTTGGCASTSASSPTAQRLANATRRSAIRIEPQTQALCHAGVVGRLRWSA